MTPADTILLAWLALASMATFLLFGFDKWRAGRSGRRVPEFQLALWSALGGWPGGLCAMAVFRHKTSKGRFLLKFAGALVVFAGWIVLYLRFR